MFVRAQLNTNHLSYFVRVCKPFGYVSVGISDFCFCKYGSFATYVPQSLNNDNNNNDNDNVEGNTLASYLHTCLIIKGLTRLDYFIFLSYLCVVGCRIKIFVKVGVGV